MIRSSSLVVRSTWEAGNVIHRTCVLLRIALHYRRACFSSARLRTEEAREHAGKDRYA